MPSNKNPKGAVNPGPGKLPAGVVPAGALLFPSGGGSDASLQAHIINPVDAHMASAIGVNPFDAFGFPILSSVGGVVDGESVLDFINEFKDLIPPHPNFLGFNLPAGVNSGIPDWNTLNAFGVGAGTAMTGGYAIGATTTPSHFLVPSLVGSFTLGGVVFPADRGVLALYKNTDGNFFNAGATTLVTALSLNTVAPAGIPNGAFNETLRKVQQLNYVAAGAGIDFISLTWRLPYLKSYVPYPGAPYAPYGADFFRFQLATYAVAAQAVAAGGAQNWLLVHWRETFATTLASIQPANLTVGNLVLAKAYSAVPVASNFDDNTQGIYNVNRHRVYNDASSALAPTINTFTTSTTYALATQFYSGIPFVNASGFLTFDGVLSANNLFSRSFDTGSVDNPPDVPAQFHSAVDPMTISFSDFGGTSQLLPYDSLHPTGPNPLYSIANAPQPADVGEYTLTALPITAEPSTFTPDNAVGYSVLYADLHKPFTSSLANPDASKKYLYNTHSPGFGYGAPAHNPVSFEGFVNERYRYISTYAPVGGEPILPGGGNVYSSLTSLGGDLDSAQIIADNLTYPQFDFSTADFFPPGVNYSGLPAGDGANHKRRHVRAFDTGLARNTGTLRIRFLAGHGAQSSFTVDAPYDATETTGHITGGMIIQVMVPGATGWLDIGRAQGDPGLGLLDFFGCSTGVSVVGPDIFVTFATGAFTANNGTGEFPLFVRATLLNNVAGLDIRLDELEWLP
jgi:hypothetical protein